LKLGDVVTVLFLIQLVNHIYYAYKGFTAKTVILSRLF